MLRAAIQEANASADSDTIQVPAGTYTLVKSYGTTTIERSTIWGNEATGGATLIAGSSGAECVASAGVEAGGARAA